MKKNKNEEGEFNPNTKTNTINTQKFKDAWKGADIPRVVEGTTHLRGLRRLISHELAHLHKSDRLSGLAL